MKLKKICPIMCALVICFSLSACGSEEIEQVERIEIPQIKNVDEATAKTLLLSSNLVPVIEYEYDNNIEKGCVIKTNPPAGYSVLNNTVVTIYISKGPSYIESSNSRITWWNVSSGQDKWEFNSPYIIEDKLYINCYVTFAAKVKWQDNYNEGILMGIGSVNDTYDKSVPVSAVYQKQEWAPNESQSFSLEIPLQDLDVEKPTSLYITLWAYVNGVNKKIEISFTISW